MLLPTAQTMPLLRSIFTGAELLDASSLLQKQRARKTASEIAKIRTANAISCLGLEAFARSVQVGVSRVELVAEVEREIIVRGSGFEGAARVRGYAQVATGPTETVLAHRPSEISTQRALRPGELAMLELAIVADGYWADRTRVRVAGQPSAEQIGMFEAVQSAQRAALAAAARRYRR